MNILLVTSRLAVRSVSEAVDRAKQRGAKHSIDVLVLPVDVIAILSTQQLLNLLLRMRSEEEFRGYDLIIVPGLVRGSTKVIEDRIGVPVVKGTIHAAMLDDLLLLSDDELLSLSREVPADEVVTRRIVDDARRKLQSLEDVYKSNHLCTMVGGVCVPLRPPPQRVVALTLLSKIKQCRDVVSRLKDADIVGIAIDVDTDPNTVMNMLKILEKEISKPLAIDAHSPKLIERVSQHVDLVLNVRSDMLHHIPVSIRREICISITPLEAIEKSIEKSEVTEAVNYIVSLIEKARSLGYEKIVLDLVLKQPLRGFVSSVVLYYYVHNKVNVPLQMNLSNVVEFMDADSYGAIALLMAMAQELGVSLLTVYEIDGRSYGIAKEAVLARSMITTAVLRGVPPRSVGVDLFVAKEPRPIDIDIVGERNPVIIDVPSDHDSEFSIDPMGLFRIRVDRYNKRIEMLYMGRKGLLLLRGSDPKALLREVIRRGLVSTPQHLAYLGYELAKAEIALRLGKSYIQDEPVIRGVFERVAV